MLTVTGLASDLITGLCRPQGLRPAAGEMLMALPSQEPPSLGNTGPLSQGQGNPFAADSAVTEVPGKWRGKILRTALQLEFNALEYSGLDFPPAIGDWQEMRGLVCPQRLLVLSFLQWLVYGDSEEAG